MLCINKCPQGALTFLQYDNVRDWSHTENSFFNYCYQMWFSKLLNHRVHTLYRSFCLSVCKIKWHGVKIYLRFYLNSLKAKMIFLHPDLWKNWKGMCFLFHDCSSQWSSPVGRSLRDCVVPKYLISNRVSFNGTVFNFPLDLCSWRLSDLPTVILVCMLSRSTSTLLRMTANKATKMYVRLMSNTIDVPETQGRDVTA